MFEPNQLFVTIAPLNLFQIIITQIKNLMFNFDCEEEYVVGDDDDMDFDDEEVSLECVSKYDYSKIQTNVNDFCSLFPFINVEVINSNEVNIIIPTIVLPSSLQLIGGFHYHKTLLNIKIILSEASWKSKPEKIEVSHPIYKRNFVGRPLVESAIKSFFSPDYVPLRNKANALTQLINAGKGISKDGENLKGTKEYEDLNSKLTYEKYPFAFLIYEIIAAFLDLSGHCCICRKKLLFSGIKPSICDNKLCKLGFDEIGIGTSVAQEIHRDPTAADFILTIFALSYGTKYCETPTDLNIQKGIFSMIPSMNEIAKNCVTDADIKKKYGEDILELLKYVILSNKAQIITLPDKFKFKEIPVEHQFMTIISTQKSEFEFQERKKINGSIYLWHGSGFDRWNSIVRNGLMNMSNRSGDEVIHGDLYGPGIYFAMSSGTSFGYLTDGHNPYKNSILPKKISFISLCEVVPNKSFKKCTTGIATLQDEKACIVRFVFPVRESFSFAPNKNLKVPTLSEILKYQGENYSSK